MLFLYVSGFPEDKICDNIYIGDCDVSGMTRVESKEALTERLEQDKLLTVTLKVGEKHTVATLEELGIQCQKIDQCTKDAVEYGKTGSVWVRSRKIGRLKKEKKVFSCKLSLDQEQAAQGMETRARRQAAQGPFSPDAGGGERWQNLTTGVTLIDGTVLMPGEKLSVHDKTAPYDGEHGYVEAGSYENGQVVNSFGGGICQVSTTLYNAVLYAELEVGERYPHSMIVA